MRNVYLGIGANLGDRKKNLRRAVELISQIEGTELISVSSFYETAPWGNLNQPNFINGALRIKTELPPLKLLDELQDIENKLGRVRNEHWGARTIDIDILMIDDIVIDTERLKVPHPFMFERDFVLIPLSEICNIKFKPHGDKVIKTNGSPVDFNFNLIACISENLGLGYKGQLLFHIDEDLRRFKDLTINQTVIMGRKTFESLPNKQPLKNRRNIILSRSINKINGVEIAANLEELYNLLSIQENNFVIGGAQIYNQFMPFITKAYITVVHETKAADTFLTDFDKRDDFMLNSCEIKNGFEFRIYQKTI